MAKPNYHHARRQKELIRKTRQQEKQQRKAARSTPPVAGDEVNPTGEAGAAEAGAPRDPTSVSEG